MLKAFKKSLSWFNQFFAFFAKSKNYKLLWIKLFFFTLLVILGGHFYSNVQAYKDAVQKPSFGSLLLTCKGIGAGLALLAGVSASFLSKKRSVRFSQRIITVSLWLVAIGTVIAVVPADYLNSQASLSENIEAGGSYSRPVYIGKLLLVIFLILSIPLLIQVYYRQGMMDQYILKEFIEPFGFCMVSIISILLIADFTDNGGDFGGLYDRMAKFYIVKIPAMVLEALPICILLALFFSLSKLSKSNEFISMIGAGRSVLRILSPLLILGFYFSVVGLALKFEWAPTSDGTSESILQEAKEEVHRLEKLKQAKNKRKPQPSKKKLWSKTGWMHVNEASKRNWFVGYVPLELQNPMRNVIVFSTDAQGQLSTVWQAQSVNWNAGGDMGTWTLTDGKTYHYNQAGLPSKIPIIKKFDSLTMTDWNETPWKVLSSAQNPEYLGMSGLTNYLKANKEMDNQDLAKFKTHRWAIFAEPFSCLAIALMAAPLGIVYGRKSPLSGFITAIIVFALMYLISNTTIALGKRSLIPPFWAAWSCYIIIAIFGVILIWFRTRNRELPKVRQIISLGLIK